MAVGEGEREREYRVEKIKDCFFFCCSINIIHT